MGLEKYKDLQSKVKAQMQSQTEEVELLIVKDFAKKYNLDIKDVSNYEEAKKYVEENVNTTPAIKKEFYQFEKQARGILVGNVKDLEYGASSDATKKIRSVGEKLKPILNTVIKAVSINFLAYHAIDFGLMTAGNFAYDKAVESINNMDLIGELDFGDIETPFGVGENTIQGFADSIENSINNFTDGIENNITSGLTSFATDAHNSYNNFVVPVVSKVSASILGYFQAKGIIKNFKINNLENQVDKQQENMSKLESQSRVASEKDSSEDTYNSGRQSQMVLLVNNLQELFKSESINFNLPDIPKDCLSMEEYGDLIKKQIIFHTNEISDEDKVKINTILNIYKNSIENISKDSSLGKPGAIERNIGPNKKSIAPRYNWNRF